jgi:anti-anti-sigma regulatory factor
MALRITFEENAERMVVKLEGRIVGPWAAELDRLWAQTSPSLASRKVSLDLRETTYADAGGIRVLRAIYSQTEAAILTSTPWTQYLADEVTRKSENHVSPEASDAIRS